MDLSTLNLLLVILIVFVGILTAAIIFMMYLMHKTLIKNSSHQESEKNLDVNETFKKKIYFEPLNGYCFNHEKEVATNTCGICERPICEKCVRSHESLSFCPEHHQTFLSNQWRVFKSFETTPQTPEKGTTIYQFKRKIWDEQAIPTYLETHYKINHQSDEIESVIYLYAQDYRIETLNQKYQEFEKKADQEQQVH